MNAVKVMPELNNVSSKFMPIITSFASRSDRVLEFGSSTGHMCFAMAKNGYDVSLLDIREEPIREATEIFTSCNVKAKFYIGDFLGHSQTYDFIFNSGLLQCLKDEDKRIFVEHAAKISSKLLLFYPIRHDTIFARGASKIQGVDGCIEYSTQTIRSIVMSHFNKTKHGVLSYIDGLDCDFEWVFGEKE